MASTSGTPPPGSHGGQIETIMAEHETALLRYATRILNDPDAAQDVVQETFIKLVELWKQVSKSPEELIGWLYRVTHNAAVDHVRKESRLRLLHERQAADAAPAADCPPPRQLERSEAVSLAMTCVRQLDPAEQQVVILRVQEGLSYKEISAITGRSEGNVGCILHHAVKSISASLRKAGAI